MRNNKDSFVPNTAAGIHRTVISKYAFLGELSVLDASTVDFCNVTVMKETFYTARWAFIQRKDWKYRAELDKA